MSTTLQYIVNRFLTEPKGFVQTIFHTSNYFLKDLIRSKHCENRLQLLSYSLQHTRPVGLILEFGVASGQSINYLANLTPKEIIYGFDCFTGLPESWGILPKGHFKTERLPQVRANVKLIPGLFQETLEIFLQEHSEKIRLLHLDADLYSSTIYVLKTLFENRRIQAGTVIQFDELFNYLNWWKDGEYKALIELAEKFEIEYEILGHSLFHYYSPGQVAIRIKKCRMQHS